MFDKTLRELKRLNGSVISVSLPEDEDGYLDRQCSENSCNAEFKVFTSDWKDKVKDERVYCPVCRYEAPASEWNTPHQLEYARKVGVQRIKSAINNALKEDVNRFNGHQSRGFISLSLSLKSSPPEFILPIEAAKLMRQKFTCDECGCRYAAIGAAFFCPACGHNSAISMFQQTVASVHDVVSRATTFRQILLAEFGEDFAQNSMRLLLEESLGHLTSAFQRFVEALFLHLPNAGNFNLRKNIFQNLQESTTLWRNATGKGYEDFLSSTEMGDLQRLFQKRHVLAHCSGIVDQDYINKSGDKTYSVGQRLVIKEADVVQLATLLSKLTDELKKLV